MKRMVTFIATVFFIIFMLANGRGLAQQELPQEPSEQTKEVISEEGTAGPVRKSFSNGAGLITMDFEDADMRDVIGIIAMASGLNMIIGEGVKAKVTVSLKEVPWERALDVILRTYNFTYKREEKIIRIMTFEKVKQEERDIPLVTKIVYLNFADVSDLKNTLAKMLSDRGSIETDKRTNSMLINDIPAKLEELEQIARQLDTRTPQVLIEAMLVDVKLTKDDELGINWNIVQVDRSDAWRGKDIATAKTNDYNYIEQPSDVMNNLGSSAIRFGWLERLGTFRIDGLIQAWAQDAKANILASPKIVTLDNQTAKIEIKSQVAYTQATQSDQGGTTTSTQFKDVITGLEATPHITKEGFISMNVKPRQEFIEAWPGGEPQIGSRSAETNVLVKDGQTIIIGGLRKVEDSATYTKVPILGDIPFIGNLFRKKDVQKVNTELVMFVTPHIIIDPELTDEEIDRYEMLEGARGDILEEWEKEKKKRLKKSKKQAFLVEPEVMEEMPTPLEERTDLLDTPVVQPTVKQEKISQDLEKDKGYIYVW